MFISAILVALLATCGQWWFFGPITKCLVYPLTTGTLVGVFMGDPMTGMLAGANIQLIYLGWISAGGTMPSNTIVAGIFGTAMTILSGADPTMAVTFAIPFSMLGLLQNQVYMTTNAAWIHQADKMLEKGNLRGVRLMNFLPSFCMAFLLYGVPAFAMVMFGSGWAESLINAVPENVISALQVVCRKHHRQRPFTGICQFRLIIIKHNTGIQCQCTCLRINIHIQILFCKFLL